MGNSNNESHKENTGKQPVKRSNSAQQSMKGFERQEALRQSLSRPSPSPAGEEPGVEQQTTEGTEQSSQGQVASEPDEVSDKVYHRKAASTRMTVDLPAEQHAFLKRYVARSGSDGMRVMRALLRRLEEDEELSRTVMDDLIEERLREASEG